MPLAWLNATCPAPTSIKGEFLQSSSSHSIHKNTLKPTLFKELLQFNISILFSVMALGLYQIQKLKNTGITACGIKI